MAENYKYQSISFHGEGGTSVVLYKNANNLTVALGHVEGKFWCNPNEGKINYVN